MDIKTLKYFVQVAEAGSFVKASALLSMTQPGLSRHVHRLEEELGVRLLNRDGRGISLTPAGRILFAHARSMAADMDATMNELAALQTVPRGEVTVAVPPTVSLLLLPSLVKNLRTHYPHVSLRVLQGLSGDINEWLVNGRLDAAVLSSSPATRQRGGEILVVEDLSLIGPPDAPSGDIPLRALERVPLVLPTTPHGLRTAVQTTAAKSAVNLSVILEIDSLSMLIRVVLEGIGYTVLPPYAAANEIRLGLVSARRIVDPPVQRTLLLATGHANMLTSASRLVVDLIRREIAALTKNKRWKTELAASKAVRASAQEPGKTASTPPR